MSTRTLGPPVAPAASTPAQVLHGFHPGWFGAVMGTGIVGVAAYLNPGGSHTLFRPAHALGVAVVLAAWLLAVAITVPYLARIVRHSDAALADLRHPLIGGLYATFPAALLVLAVATATVGGSVLPEHATVAVVAVLAAVGSLLAFAVAVGFTYLLFSGEGLPTETANGGWFIPPVVAIIIPLTLLPLLPHVGLRAGRLLLLAGYSGLGIGFFLYLLVAAVLFARLVFHPLPPAPLAPSLWIGLGPIGVGSLALLRLAAAGKPYWGAEAGRGPAPLRTRRRHPLGVRPLVARHRRPACLPATCAADRSPTASDSGASPSRSAPTPSPPSSSAAPGPPGTRMGRRSPLPRPRRILAFRRCSHTRRNTHR